MASSRTLHKQEVEQERFRSVLRAMNLLQDGPASGSQQQQQRFCAFCRSNGRTSVPAIGVCSFCEKPCCGNGCSRVCNDCGSLFCLTCSVVEFATNSPISVSVIHIKSYMPSQLRHTIAIGRDCEVHQLLSRTTRSSSSTHTSPAGLTTHTDSLPPLFLPPATSHHPSIPPIPVCS